MGNTTLVDGLQREVLRPMYGVACAANATTTCQLTTGIVGDYLDSVVIVPTTLSPGSISVQDGSGTTWTIFAGGASSIATLHSFVIQLGWISRSGAWKVISSNANVAAVANGAFT